MLFLILHRMDTVTGTLAEMVMELQSLVAKDMEFISTPYILIPIKQVLIPEPLGYTFHLQ